MSAIRQPAHAIKADTLRASQKLSWFPTGRSGNGVTSHLDDQPAGDRVPRMDFSRVPVRIPSEGAVHPLDFNPAMDPRTPAITEDGRTRLGPAALWMSPTALHKIVRHEATHALHQRIAPRDESPGARVHAEEMAARAERGGSIDRADLFVPVPSRLAYPPQQYGPWTTVWIGGDLVIGEVEEAGIKVRIAIGYDELKLGSDWQYVCGKHDLPPIPDIVARMKQVAGVAARNNVKLPTGTTQRVATVFIFGSSGENSYRTFDGSGAIVLQRNEFDIGVIDPTLAHESSHAVFEFHSMRGDRDPAKRVPDALALRVAAIFNELRETVPVPRPDAKFDRKAPPSLTGDGSMTTLPAGIAMVTDALWAGEGGHPWGGVDEFFASAYGAYMTDPALLKDILTYYGKADRRIPALANELIDLLATVGKPKAYGAIKAPAGAKTLTAAKEALDRVGAPNVVDGNTASLGYLGDPTRMPARETIGCPTTGGTAAKKEQGEFDDVLDPTLVPDDAGRPDRPVDKRPPKKE